MPANSSRCEGKVEASGAAKTNRIVHPIKSSLALRQQKYKWRARFRTELSRHCCPISGYARRRFSRLRAQSGRGQHQFQRCILAKVPWAVDGPHPAPNDSRDLASRMRGIRCRRPRTPSTVSARALRQQAPTSVLRRIRHDEHRQWRPTQTNLPAEQYCTDAQIILYWGMEWVH